MPSLVKLFFVIGHLAILTVGGVPNVAAAVGNNASTVPPPDPSYIDVAAKSGFAPNAEVYAPLEYETIMEGIRDLQRTNCSNILTITTAQKLYGDKVSLDAPFYTCGSKKCEIMIVRLTSNDDYRPDMPEMFISGTVHGNERLGPPTSLEFIKLFCHMYEKHPIITYLLKTRAIWIMPITNAWGYAHNRREENGIDINRDFPYQRSESRCMQSLAARAVNEFMREHLFQVAATYHGGTRVLTYEWGSFDHSKSTRDAQYKSKNSPDSVCQTAIAKALQQAAGLFDPEGGFETKEHDDYRRRLTDVLADQGVILKATEDGSSLATSPRSLQQLRSRSVNTEESATKFKWFYPIGPMSDLVYPVDGGLEDWSYSASWQSSPDPISICRPTDRGGYPADRTQYDGTDALRVSMYLVEADFYKSPPAWQYGNSSQLLLNSANDGHIPRNLRLLLKMAELLEPDLLLLERPFLSTAAVSSAQSSATSTLAVSLAVLPVGCLTLSSLDVVVTSKKCIENGGRITPEANVLLHQPLIDGPQNCSSIGLWEDWIWDFSTNQWTSDSVRREGRLNLSITVPPTASALIQQQEACLYLVATFDQDWKDQKNPDPDLPPQTNIAKARLEETYFAKAGNVIINSTKVKSFPRSNRWGKEYPSGVPLNRLPRKSNLAALPSDNSNSSTDGFKAIAAGILSGRSESVTGRDLLLPPVYSSLLSSTPTETRRAGDKVVGVVRLGSTNNLSLGTSKSNCQEPFTASQCSEGHHFHSSNSSRTAGEVSTHADRILLTIHRTLSPGRYSLYHYTDSGDAVAIDEHTPPNHAFGWRRGYAGIISAAGPALQLNADASAQQPSTTSDRYKSAKRAHSRQRLLEFTVDSGGHLLSSIVSDFGAVTTSNSSSVDDLSPANKGVWTAIKLSLLRPLSSDNIWGTAMSLERRAPVRAEPEEALTSHRALSFPPSLNERLALAILERLPSEIRSSNPPVSDRLVCIWRDEKGLDVTSRRIDTKQRLSDALITPNATSHTSPPADHAVGDFTSESEASPRYSAVGYALLTFHRLKNSVAATGLSCRLPAARPDDSVILSAASSCLFPETPLKHRPHSVLRPENDRLWFLSSDIPRSDVTCGAGDKLQIRIATPRRMTARRRLVTEKEQPDQRTQPLLEGDGVGMPTFITECILAQSTASSGSYDEVLCPKLTLPPPLYEQSLSVGQQAGLGILGIIAIVCVTLPLIEVFSSCRLFRGKYSSLANTEEGGRGIAGATNISTRVISASSSLGYCCNEGDGEERLNGGRRLSLVEDSLFSTDRSCLESGGGRDDEYSMVEVLEGARFEEGRACQLSQKENGRGGAVEMLAR